MVMLNDEVRNLYNNYLNRLYAIWSKSNSGDFNKFLEDIRTNNKRLVEFMETIGFSIEPLILEVGAGSKDSLCEHMNNKKEIYLASRFAVAEDFATVGIHPRNCANADIGYSKEEGYHLDFANDTKDLKTNGVNEHLRPEVELATPRIYVFPDIENFGTLIASGVGSVFPDSRIGLGSMNYVNMLCSAIKNKQNCFMGYCGEKDSELSKRALQIYQFIKEEIEKHSSKSVDVRNETNSNLIYCYMMKKS